MDVTEVAGWVRQFSDTIAGERDAVRRVRLVQEWSKAVEHETRRLVGGLIYDLRADGYSSLEVAAMLRVQQQTANAWGRRHAATHRLPWPLPHPKAPRDVVEA